MIIKYSVEDLPLLNFRYVVQLNNHDTQDCIFDSGNTMFWVEKRIRFVSVNPDGCYLLGMYYTNHEKLSKDRLVQILNGNEKRYYRLLNSKELDYFTKWLKRDD
jgi:hypothetical protein